MRDFMIYGLARVGKIIRHRGVINHHRIFHIGKTLETGHCGIRKFNSRPVLRKPFDAVLLPLHIFFKVGRTGFVRGLRAHPLGSQLHTGSIPDVGRADREGKIRHILGRKFPGIAGVLLGNAPCFHIRCSCHMNYLI